MILHGSAFFLINQSRPSIVKMTKNDCDWWFFVLYAEPECPFQATNSHVSENP